MEQSEKTLDMIVNLCKNRGYVFPGSEIYGGLANSWDYGPLGVEFKNNVKKAWLKKFVQESPYNVGLDAAIIMNPQTWVTTGHVSSFSDPLLDCRACKARHRADKLIGEEHPEVNVDAMSFDEMDAFIAEHEDIVCPVCGNVLHATGQAVVSCCGITLPALDIAEAEDADEHHQLTVERVEDELFVTLHHPMEKNHYISFLAYLTGDKLQLVKLYPEGNASARFSLRGAGVLYFYCNCHGLMKAPDFRTATRRTSPQKIHLREPDEGDREQVMAYREEFLAIGSRMDGTSALDKYADFDAWLAQLRKLKDPATTPAGLVPATEYLALDEHEHLVGMTNLRHRLNDYLLTYGGHIGYSVRPSERQNGYATQMLRLTLEKAKERGIEKVRICCDHYNVASAKTIRANGGVLEDEQFDSSDGTLTQRYWIQNK